MRSTGYKYYYERRPHQYDDRDDIRQHNIVSAPSLIKSFVSVALEEPHKVHYYYGTLPEEVARCRVCGERIMLDRIECRRCETPHHKDCWDYNGRCATYACGETRYRSN